MSTPSVELISPQFDASNTSRNATGPIVILQPTAVASGTSDAVGLSKGAGPFVVQVNDGGESSTVTLQGSLDGENWGNIFTCTAGVVVQSTPLVYVPRVRVVWSGNTGTLAVIASATR